MNFNDFFWHDAIIKKITIDRSEPGIIDEISLDIEWPEQKGNSVLVFEEVYWATLNLNFGIVADETILDAAILDVNDKDLINFYVKWNGMLDDVKIDAYEIRLNSTGGQVKILAKGFRVGKI